jgi:hypothetical protein
VAGLRTLNPVSKAAANDGKIQNKSQKSLNVELAVTTLLQKPPLLDNH